MNDQNIQRDQETETPPEPTFAEIIRAQARRPALRAQQAAERGKTDNIEKEKD